MDGGGEPARQTAGLELEGVVLRAEGHAEKVRHCLGSLTRGLLKEVTPIEDERRVGAGVGGWGYREISGRVHTLTRKVKKVCGSNKTQSLELMTPCCIIEGRNCVLTPPPQR